VLIIFDEHIFLSFIFTDTTTSMAEPFTRLGSFQLFSWLATSSALKSCSRLIIHRTESKPGRWFRARKAVSPGPYISLCSFAGSSSSYPIPCDPDMVPYLHSPNSPGGNADVDSIGRLIGNTLPSIQYYHYADSTCKPIVG